MSYIPDHHDDLPREAYGEQEYQHVGSEHYPVGPSGKEILTPLFPVRDYPRSACKESKRDAEQRNPDHTLLLPRNTVRDTDSNHYSYLAQENKSQGTPVNNKLPHAPIPAEKNILRSNPSEQEI